MKERFLKDLREHLSKKLYKGEVDDIISYYDEMIEERLSRGETIEGIVASYDLKTIVLEMAADYIIKREKTPKSLYNSSTLLLILLLSTPVLLPLGISYLVLLIVSFSMILTGVVLMGSGVFVALAYVVQVLFVEGVLADRLIFLGTGFIGAAVMMLTGYIMIYVFKFIIIHMIFFFSKLMKSKGGQ